MSFDKLNKLLRDDGGKARKAKVEAGPKILVVDDDPAIRDALGTVLADAYTVVTCASAREAVSAVSDETMAVILDIKMKGHDGFWASDKIREKHPHLPIIFYSAYQDAKDPYRIINEHRPFAYLGKDGDIQSLRTTIDQAVRLYEMIVSNEKLIERLRRARDARG